VEVYILTRGDGSSIERGWPVVPAAKSGFDLFVDAVSDGLQKLGFNHIARGVDGHFNDDIADNVMRKRRAVDRRIRIDDRIRDVDFVAGDRAVNHGSERRSGLGVLAASVGVSDDRLRRGFWRLRFLVGMRARLRLGYLCREQQLGGIGRRILGARWNIDQLVSMRTVSEGEPFRAGVIDSGIMKDDYSEQCQMCGYRSSDDAIAPEARDRLNILGLSSSKHGTY